MTPYFSIVIPTYNRESVINDCLQSCLDQTFSDYEIIVVDDGSTDATTDVVKNRKDSRIRIISQENAGGAIARNVGITASSGKYIAFLDSDDRFSPRKLSVVHNELRRRGEPSNLVLFSQIKVDRGASGSWVKPYRAPRPTERISNYVMADRGFIQTSSIVVPTQLAKRTLFESGLPFGQDTDFVVRLEKNGATFHMLEEPLVEWSDLYSPTRVSNGSGYPVLEAWLERQKDFISPEAYYSFRGFHLAKLAKTESYRRAWQYFFTSLMSGKVSRRIAVPAFLQLLLGQKIYRRTIDTLVVRPFGDS